MVEINARWEGLREWEASETQWQRDVITKTINEVEKTALRIERDAKLLTPVDTGDLRRSITTDISRKSSGVLAEVGTDVYYSIFVEFGTFRNRAQPYLIPSFDRNVNSLERTLTNILRG